MEGTGRKKYNGLNFRNKILSNGENNYPQWFSDGKLNMCYCSIDRHIEDGFGDQVAIVYDSPVNPSEENLHISSGKREIAKLAGGLVSLGLKRRHSGYLYAYDSTDALLPCWHVQESGVIHNVVFGGFAPHEIVVRIDDCKPKVLITATAGVKKLQKNPLSATGRKAIELAQDKVEQYCLYTTENR